MQEREYSENCVLMLDEKEIISSIELGKTSECSYGYNTNSFHSTTNGMTDITLEKNGFLEDFGNYWEH